VEQFKLTPKEADKRLKSVHYSLADLRSGMSVRGFAQRVLRYTAAVGADSVLNQLLQIWTKLDPVFQLHVPQPTPDLTTIEFLDLLCSKEKIWRKIARNVPALPLTQADHLPESVEVMKLDQILNLASWNYETWKLLVHSQLNQYYLGDLIDWRLERPSETHIKYRTWDKLSRRVNAWLMLQLEDEMLTDLLDLHGPLVYADETMKAVSTIMDGDLDGL